jgi:transcriptional regulator with XRE-family HTH domain
MFPMTTTTEVRLSSIVAANVRAQAAMRGWTQREMCRRLGIAVTAMSDRYRERVPWTLDELAQLAALFDIEVSDLVARPKGFEPLTF